MHICKHDNQVYLAHLFACGCGLVHGVVVSYPDRHVHLKKGVVSLELLLGIVRLYMYMYMYWVQSIPV